MDYDYNTSRKKLALPEYGRNIQKMVDKVTAIENREERNQAARAMIGIMGNMNPHLRDVSDFKHKLWDHLALISDFKIDIDSPYPIPTLDTLNERPKPMSYNICSIKYKHYGKVIEMMIHKAAEMEEGEEKESLINLIANHMKKSYLTWNREMVSDEVIFHDLEELSEGKIKINKDQKLAETKDILAKTKKRKNIKRGR